LLKHLLRLRLEHELLTQTKRGVVVLTFHCRRNVTLPQAQILLWIAREGLTKSASVKV